jgi:hypothetical protein
VNKPWQPYARHILDAIAKIRRIQARGDLTQDEVLYDAALRNLQTLSEATQLLPDDKKAVWAAIPLAGNQRLPQYPGAQLSGHHRFPDGGQGDRPAAAAAGRLRPRHASHGAMSCTEDTVVHGTTAN